MKVLATHRGINGMTHEAVLQNPDGSYKAKPDFVIKMIDGSRRDDEKYRNTSKELIQEYEAYYLLALAKRAGKFKSVIEKFTPTCYGLYQGTGRFKSVFALVTSHVGNVERDKTYDLWSGSNKHVNFSFCAARLLK